MVRAVERTKKVKETLSDRNFDTVRQELMAKTKILYCDLQDNFEGLSKTAKRAHIRAMLNDFAEEAGKDCRELGSVVTRDLNVNVETDERHLGMFGHLLSADVSSLSDEEKVIINALKVSDNLRNVFSIMSNEYKDKRIRNFFETLSKHEIHRENELEQLYEDLIVRGQW